MQLILVLLVDLELVKLAIFYLILHHNQKLTAPQCMACCFNPFRFRRRYVLSIYNTGAETFRVATGHLQNTLNYVKGIHLR